MNPETEKNAAPRSSGTGVAMAALIGVAIGALMGAMVAMPLANNARLHQAYPRAIMNLMQRDYDRLADAVAQGRCELAANSRLTRLHSLAADSPEAFKAQDDADFVAANQKLMDALDASSSSENCRAAAEHLDKIDRQCESCHSDYR